MEWQPRYDFVNVILNVDFLGCYWLVEAVGTGEYRCNIQDSGYLIECDAYWWNSNDEYFKIFIAFIKCTEFQGFLSGLF